MDIFKTAKTIPNFIIMKSRPFETFWEHLKTTKSQEISTITWDEMWATQVQESGSSSAYLLMVLLEKKKKKKKVVFSIGWTN